MEKMKISEVASFLSCHVLTVRRLEKRGVLKAKRNFLGWRIFDKAEVQALKEERERLRN